MTTRIGLFIDGGFFHHLWDNLKEKTGQRVSLIALRKELERYFEGSVTEAYYVRGRLNHDGPLDKVLEAARIERHDVYVRNGREVGADVKLALLAQEAALMGRIDAAYVMSVDGDMAPLVDDMVALGVRVGVPDIDIHDAVTAPDDSSYRLSTSHLLLRNAEGVSWAEMVRRTCTEPGQLPVVSDQPGGKHAGTSRRGVITFVHPDKGFALVEDTQGHTWYAAPNPTYGEKREVDLEPGVMVKFAGAPSVRPGTNYPRAYSLTPDTEDPKPHENER